MSHSYPEKFTFYPRTEKIH